MGYGLDAPDLESDAARGYGVATGDVDPESLEDVVSVAEREGDVGDVAGRVVGTGCEGGSPGARLVVGAVDRWPASAEKLDEVLEFDVEGDEAHGEGEDLGADLGGADVDDDGLDLRLGPLDEAVVGIDD